MQLYIGTYTRGTRSNGIYSVSLNAGLLGNVQLVAETENPSYLAWAPGENTLYAVIETGDCYPSGGGLASFSRSDQFSVATVTMASEGQDPCHISVAPGGRYLVLSNYSSGTLSSIALDDGGSPARLISVVRHEGSSGATDRQLSPHVHSTVIAGNQVHVLDLGLDEVISYWLGPEGGIAPEPAATIRLAAGAGPRHMARTSDSKRWFVLNELDNTMAELRQHHGQFDLVSAVSTLPDGYTGRNDCAEIQVSEDDRFVYASNRGHDSIAVFKIDHQEPELVQTVSTHGVHPRHFRLLASCIIIANRDSNNLVAMARDADTGMLGAVTSEVEVPAPVFVLPEQGT